MGLNPMVCILIRRREDPQRVTEKRPHVYGGRDQSAAAITPQNAMEYEEPAGARKRH